MTDIVERLREQPTMSIFANIGDMVGRLNHERGEAADEIERLREMVKYFACHCGGECDRSDGNCLISQAALGEKE